MDGPRAPSTRLCDATRRLVREALDATPLGDAGLAFVEAVIVQRAYPLGEQMTPDSVTEEQVAEKVACLVTWSDMEDEAKSHAAKALASDPALLAAFFQNLDLLPTNGPPPVGQIALLVAGALQWLADTSPDA